jgi:hypothetical protein
MRSRRVRRPEQETVAFSQSDGSPFFSAILIPENVHVLQLSDNRFIDFQGLESLLSLHTLILDRNPIVSFRYFPLLPKLRSLSLIGSPIAELPNFRALALLSAGPHLAHLNDTDITASDRAAAAQYGDLARPLLLRGWLPRKPIALASVPLPVQSPPSALQIVEEHEEDPASLQLVRLLRTIDYTIPQIQNFFRTHFSPFQRPRPSPRRLKSENPIQIQVNKQQQFIDVLSAQLQALRSDNRLFRQYNELLFRSAFPLLENAALLARLEKGDEAGEKTNVYGESDYDALRSAAIAYLRAEPDTPDDDLIEEMNEIREEQEMLESKRPTSLSFSGALKVRKRVRSPNPVADDVESETNTGSGEPD